MKYTVSGNLDEIAPTGTREFELLIEELWRDAAIQATYNRRNELEMLPRNASYFLERVSNAWLSICPYHSYSPNWFTEFELKLIGVLLIGIK